MVLEYVPQYRDETEAASARFPGDAANPRAAGAPARFGAIGWICVALVLVTLCLLVAPRGRRGNASPIYSALAEADRIDHPVFIAGIVLVAVGGAMVVVPIAYLLALRRSARPLVAQSIRVDLGDDFITLRLPSKELTVSWQGVVAFAETRHVFVLKTLGDLRLALPKRAVPGVADSPAAVDALRELLRRRVTPFAGVAGEVPGATPRLAA